MKTIKINKIHFLVLMVILSAIGVLSFMDTSNAATEVYVDTNGDDNNPGTDVLPYKTINFGIQQVENTGTVYIGPGTYSTHSDVNHKDYNITIEKNVTVNGAGRDQTIIDPENNGRVFTINSGFNLTLKNLKIQNSTETVGGAINNHGTLNIENCTFENNHGTVNGGAINNWLGTLNISDSEFNNNYAGSGNYGGAIFNSNGDLTIINTKFNGNHADVDGGAIYDGFGTNSIINIIGCEFKDNYVTNDGGAIYISGTLTSSFSSFTGNYARRGGAIINLGISTLNNCIFTQNRAEAIGITVDGGAIINIATLTLNNCLLSQNSAKSSTNAAGGAIASGGGQTLTINQSTLTQNSVEGINADGGAIALFSGNLYANYNRIYDNTAITGTAIYNTYGYVADVKYNWWGSNNPDFDTLIYNLNSANYNYSPWIYMTINSDPNTINKGETSLITANFNNAFDGTTVTPLNPADGHIPDKTLVTFNTDLGSVGSKTINKETIDGTATATLTADETAGISHVNAVTDSQTVNTSVTINPESTQSSLYLTITPSKNNPMVGDTVIYTLKVGNKGPDTAENVVMTYVVPKGLEFVGGQVDMGTYTYNPTTRTITWKIGDVPVGDPYMRLSLKVLSSGTYLINPTLSTSTYDPTLNTNTQSLTVNAAATPNNMDNTVNAATNTVNMQETGISLTTLVLAILMIACGIIGTKK